MRWLSQLKAWRWSSRSLFASCRKRSTDWKSLYMMLFKTSIGNGKRWLKNSSAVIMRTDNWCRWTVSGQICSLRLPLTALSRTRLSWDHNRILDRFSTFWIRQMSVISHWVATLSRTWAVLTFTNNDRIQAWRIVCRINSSASQLTWSRASKLEK